MSSRRFLRTVTRAACLIGVGLPALAASELICSVGPPENVGADAEGSRQALLPPEGGLTVLRAADGTIVKVGDPDSWHDPTMMNVYWFDSTGREEQASLIRRFAHGGFVALTEDGRAAVAAPSLENPKHWTVGVYRPQEGRARREWVDELDPNRRVAGLTVSPSGDATSVLTTDPGKWLADHQVEVYRGDRPGKGVSDVGQVQHTVFVTPRAGKSFLFVQGTTGYALSDLSDSLWRQAGRVRIASSESVIFVAAGPNADADVLIALEAEEGDSSEDLYDWFLVVLRFADGAVLGRCPLLGGSTEWLPSRLATADQELLSMVLGDQRFRVKWKVQ